MRIGLVALIFVAGLARAQTAAPAGLTIPRPGSLVPPVNGEPFSAQVQVVSTLPSRNDLPGAEAIQTSKFFRDSRGRIRTEANQLIGSPGGPQLLIMVSDAAAGRGCFLEAGRRIAHCFSSIPVQADQSLAGGFPEDLGMKTMEGLQAEGKRYTQTLLPQGGKGLSHSRTVEIWKSAELDLNLKVDVTDPVAGKSSTSVTGIQRGDPDAGLFQIPSEYRVVEETGATASLFGPPPAPAMPAGVYQVGSGVSQPRLIKKVEPKYSREALKQKVEGTVTVSLVVGVDGKATDISIVKSLDEGLDQQAIKAISEWRFEPGKKDGKPVPVMAKVDVNFRLAKTPVK